MAHYFECHIGIIYLITDYGYQHQQRDLIFLQFIHKIFLV